MCIRDRADLEFSLEGEWGLPVELVSPAGFEYTGLTGQVLYDTVREDPATGAQYVDHNPVVTLRVSSLDRVPVSGESWAVRIPTTPSTTDSLVTYYLERASEDGRSIGFIRLYLTLPEQVDTP